MVERVIRSFEKTYRANETNLDNNGSIYFIFFNFYHIILVIAFNNQ